MRPLNTLALCICLVGINAGCQDKAADRQQAPTATTAAKAAAPSDPTTLAATYFKQKCVVCHGATGEGDGPGAAALNPKPRAFSDAAWQDGLSDEQIRKVIVEGGAAAGKSAAMPPNPDLKGKDELVKELVAKVRSFKK